MSVVKVLTVLIDDYWENSQKRASLIGLMEEKNWFDSLLHFKNYAYERNIPGATNHYKKIAEIALKSVINRERWSPSLEEQIWDSFKEECARREIKPNNKVDPLMPSTSKNKSLVKFVWDITDNENPTATAWAVDMINNNKIFEAHKRLKSVWGIGDKIASFYLRDIFWLSHELTPPMEYPSHDNIHLIQPIDLWIKRAAKSIGFEGDSRRDIALFMSEIEQEIGIQPGGSNIAFWMLGSQYLDDLDKFENVIKALIKPTPTTKIKSLEVANYFRSYYGEFGKRLKEAIGDQ